MMPMPVQTDLVGEVVEMIDRATWDHRTETYDYQVVARGRVRAVNADKDGSLMFWLEKIDTEKFDGGEVPGGARLHDVHCVIASHPTRGCVPYIVRILGDHPARTKDK